MLAAANRLTGGHGHTDDTHESEGRERGDRECGRKERDQHRRGIAAPPDYRMLKAVGGV